MCQAENRPDNHSREPSPHRRPTRPIRPHQRGAKVPRRAPRPPPLAKPHPESPLLSPGSPGLRLLATPAELAALPRPGRRLAGYVAAGPDGFRPDDRASFRAAGALCYDLSPSGELMVLLGQFYGGRRGSKKFAHTHSAWLVPGGKRVEEDTGPEATAARELEEETLGLVSARRSAPRFESTAVWFPTGLYALFFLRLSGARAGMLPARFAEVSAAGRASAEGRATRDLMWVPLTELLEETARGRPSWREGEGGDSGDGDVGPSGAGGRAAPNQRRWLVHPFLRSLLRTSPLGAELLARRGAWRARLRHRREEETGTDAERATDSVMDGCPPPNHAAAPSPDVAAAAAPPDTRGAAATSPPSPRGLDPSPREHLAARLRAKAVRSSGLGGRTVATHTQYECALCDVSFARRSDTRRVHFPYIRMSYLFLSHSSPLTLPPTTISSSPPLPPPPQGSPRLIRAPGACEGVVVQGTAAARG